MLGIYGWEPTSTAFLQDGRYRAGGENHYAVGTYTIEGDVVNLDIKINVRTGDRVLFGKKARKFDMQFRGELNGKIIEGEAKEGPRQLMRFQATKVAELPND